MQGTLNKTTRNMLTNGTKVAAMAEANGPAAAVELEARQKGDDDNKKWTAQQFEALFVWCAYQMRSANAFLKQAALAYAAEQADDDVDNGVQEALVGRLRTIRNSVGEIAGKTERRKYGLANLPPTDLEGVIPYAENAIELLRKNPDPITNDAGLTFSPVPVADALELLLGGYVAVREKANLEAKELQMAKADHDRAVTYWNDVYQGIASQLEGLFRQAGRYQLAERVRPTWAKSTGRESDEEPVEPVEPVEA